VVIFCLGSCFYGFTSNDYQARFLPARITYKLVNPKAPPQFQNSDFGSSHLKSIQERKISLDEEQDRFANSVVT